MKADRQVRVLIANLYIRYRQARERTAKLSGIKGVEHQSFLAAEFEAWNAYQASKNVADIDVSFSSPQAFIELIGRRARNTARMRKGA